VGSMSGEITRKGGKPYGVVPFELLECRSLSPVARLVAAWIESKPEGWVVRPSVLHIETFLALLDKAVQMPKATDFIVNYSHIFPRAKLPADYDGYKANMNVLCAIFAKAYPFGDDNTELTRFLLMTHFMREMAVDAKLIIHHEIKDTPEIRLMMAKNAVFGLSNYGHK
jgi:hypothetical protein